jgi:hypothetical protein
MFLCTEQALQVTHVSPRVWCCLLGSVETIGMSLWVLTVGGVYGFRDENNDNTDMEKIPPVIPWSTILMGFTALTITNTIHAAAFFGLLSQIGAAASSLLRGLQTVVVVVVSAIWFCHPQQEPAQCWTWYKTISLGLILIGMYLYGLTTSTSSVEKKKKHEINENVEPQQQLLLDHHHHQHMP